MFSNRWEIENAQCDCGWGNGRALGLQWRAIADVKTWIEEIRYGRGGEKTTDPKDNVTIKQARTIVLGEDVIASIRPSGQSEWEGKEVDFVVFACRHPWIEIKIDHRGPPSIVQGYDILYDWRVEFAVRVQQDRTSEEEQTRVRPSPRTCCTIEMIRSDIASWWLKKKKNTFSMYSQKQTSGLPFVKYAPWEKLSSCAIVMRIRCNVMIWGWIWRRTPTQEIIAD